MITYALNLNFQTHQPEMVDGYQLSTHLQQNPQSSEEL